MVGESVEETERNLQGRFSLLHPDGQPGHFSGVSKAEGVGGGRSVVKDMPVAVKAPAEIRAPSARLRARKDVNVSCIMVNARSGTLSFCRLRHHCPECCYDHAPPGSVVFPPPLVPIIPDVKIVCVDTEPFATTPWVRRVPATRIVSGIGTIVHRMRCWPPANLGSSSQYEAD